MFGMGLGEVLAVAIVAIIFLGPEKLPEAMVKTAKFFRAIKNHLAEAKSAIDSELKLGEIKSEALEYKEKFAKETSGSISESGREIKDLFNDLSEVSKKTEQELKKGL